MQSSCLRFSRGFHVYRATPLFNNVENSLKQLTLNNNRLLYTRSALGLNGYDATRANHKKQFTNLEESFRNRMAGFLEKSDSVIFSEDLKAMLYIVEKKPQDLDLVMKMIKRYHDQKKQLRFANFTFGPVVMRAFYYLDEPDLAFKVYMDPELSDFFNQLTSLQILMDLLWNHGRYEDCLTSYKHFTEQSSNNVLFPRNASVLAAASCYKLNTKESLETGVNIIKEAEAKAIHIPRRAILFLAALAVNQNSPEIAVELVAKTQRPQYITARCIKLEAYAQLKRFDEILMILKNSTVMENPSGIKQSYFNDTMERIEEAINKEDFSPDSEIKQIFKYMKEAGYIQNLSLDKHLTSEMGGDNENMLKRNRRPNQSQSFKLQDILSTNNRFGMTGN